MANCVTECPLHFLRTHDKLNTDVEGVYISTLLCIFLAKRTAMGEYIPKDGEEPLTQQGNSSAYSMIAW